MPVLQSARAAAATAGTAIVTGLRALNTHGIGYGGLGAGAALLAAIGGLFAKLSDPGFLIDVVGEHERHEFGQHTATLAALLFAVVGAAIVAVLSCYFGMPFTAGQSSTPAPADQDPSSIAGRKYVESADFGRPFKVSPSAPANPPADPDPPASTGRK